MFITYCLWRICLSVCLSETGSQYIERKNNFRNLFEGTSLDLIRKFRFEVIFAHKKSTFVMAISGLIYAQHELLIKFLGNPLWESLRYVNNHSSSKLTQTDRPQYTRHTNCDTYSQNIPKWLLSVTVFGNLRSTLRKTQLPVLPSYFL